MRLWYRFVCAFTRSLFHVFWGVDYEGQEHVPKQGGLLVIANHLSFLDPPLVAISLPREIHFLARKTLFKKNGFGWLIRSLNSIPIDQERPDMTGLRSVIRRLKEGHAVLLFPEGARAIDGQLQPGAPGAALVAVKAGVPVLPIRLYGTFESLPRGKGGLRFCPLRVVIGPPFQLETSAKGKEDYQRVADLMMNKIAALS